MMPNLLSRISKRPPGPMTGIPHAVLPQNLAPIELWTAIFHEVTSNKDLLQIATVCIAFNALCIRIFLARNCFPPEFPVSVNIPHRCLSALHLALPPPSFPFQQITCHVPSSGLSRNLRLIKEITTRSKDLRQLHLDFGEVNLVRAPAAADKSSFRSHRILLGTFCGILADMANRVSGPVIVLYRGRIFSCPPEDIPGWQLHIFRFSPSKRLIARAPHVLKLEEKPRPSTSDWSRWATIRSHKGEKCYVQAFTKLHTSTIQSISGPLQSFTMLTIDAASVVYLSLDSPKLSSQALSAAIAHVSLPSLSRIYIDTDTIDPGALGQFLINHPSLTEVFYSMSSALVDPPISHPNLKIIEFSECGSAGRAIAGLDTSPRLNEFSFSVAICPGPVELAGLALALVNFSCHSVNTGVRALPWLAILPALVTIYFDLNEFRFLRDSEVRAQRLAKVLDAAKAALPHVEITECLAREISRLLCIPDYNTARGLKQCHQDFGKISSKLEQVFDQSRENASSCSADKLAAAVIAIYGLMSQDSLLRKRVVAETAFVQQAISLLRSEVARFEVISVLSAVTHLNDNEVMRSIARFTSAILDCVEGRLDDIQYAESTLCVLSHCTAVGLVEIDSDLAHLIPLPRVIQFFLSVVRLPTSTFLSFHHFLDFCARIAEYHAAIFHSLPDSVDFLVACTRAEDICARNDALRSLTALFPWQGVTQWTEVRLEHVDAALKQYGKTSHRQRELLQSRECFQLIETFIKNPRRSLSDFGNKLVALIMTHERGVRRYFQHRDDYEMDSGEVHRLQHNLGCRRFIDVLPLCVEAVRGASGPQAEINANILQLEFLLASGKHTEACTLARTCIERDPSVAFFYLVLTTSDDKSIASPVRAAEKGLECAGLTDYMREELLYSAASSASILAGYMLHGKPSEIRLQEAIQLAQKALLYATSFVDAAPPDGDLVPDMIALRIYLTFLMRGHTLIDGCSELQALQSRLNLTYDIARSTVRGFSPPRECLAIDTILARMSVACRVWKSVLARNHSNKYRNDVNPNDDLTAWLEKLDTSDPMSKRFAMRGTVDPSTERYGTAQLRCCSACGSPSAVLKKCSGCQEARYCNSNCQKSHWAVHQVIDIADDSDVHLTDEDASQLARKGGTPHFVEIRKLGDIDEVYDREILNLLRDGIKGLVQCHALAVPIVSEPNDHEAILLGFNGLVDVPARG
ncbi:hypothetical protein B0H16DRAFT_1886777 [Mycena metata]|uniref:MYND-type domain-containing protein n=1 Tax=Mycena metata TaxID=1033252 RepID=A0AAD7IZW7_9AGAR|nr:hypothetical protein B0H16DRAFT_1886777 [Mycena metata]